MVVPMVGDGWTAASSVSEAPDGVIFDEDEDGAAKEDTDELPRLSPQFAFRVGDLPKSQRPYEKLQHLRAEERLEEKLLVAPPEPVGLYYRRHVLPVARSRRRARRRRRRSTTARARDGDEPAPAHQARRRLASSWAEDPPARSWERAQTSITRPGRCTELRLRRVPGVAGG
jgi:hypothetical protein